MGDQTIRTITVAARLEHAHEVALDELRLLTCPQDETANRFFRRPAEGADASAP